MNKKNQKKIKSSTKFRRRNVFFHSPAEETMREDRTKRSREKSRRKRRRRRVGGGGGGRGLDQSSRLSVVVGHGAHGDFEVGCSLLLELIRHRVDLEAVESGHKLVGRPLRSVLGMNHEEHVRETGAEVSAVGVVMTR